MRKKLLRIHDAVYEPIADLSTWRAMPIHGLQHQDPFLFLNHHGPQDYPPNNNGLPFGPHPHRGFETLTFVLQGDITHKDSVSGQSVIGAGGIQWMTAGSGLVHAEVSSAEFKRKGGREEVLQLWLNLPSQLKMTEPRYIGLKKEDIPLVPLANGKGSLQLISGEYEGVQGPVDSLTDLFTSTVKLEADTSLQLAPGDGQRVFFYVIKGKLTLNDQALATHQTAELSLEGAQLDIQAQTDCHFMYCYGTPFNEPIVAHGPFVMNSMQEIHEAMRDYQLGKLGDPAALV